MGLNESLKLSYFRTDLQKNVDVTNDQDMMDMFSAFESSKYIELNAFICPLNATQSVTSNTEMHLKHQICMTSLATNPIQVHNKLL
jgi:succinate dehydrogenase/fumarate reductase flavoprotein subunit